MATLPGPVLSFRDKTLAALSIVTGREVNEIRGDHVLGKDLKIGTGLIGDFEFTQVWAEIDRQFNTRMPDVMKPETDTLARATVDDLVSLVEFNFKP